VRIFRGLAPLAVLCALAAACGPPTIRPTASPDPQVACPGSSSVWALEILDRRAEREASEKTVALLRDALVRSFPGCTWKEPGAPGVPSISIEIHRFAAPFEEATWNGVAEWSVVARNPEGKTLTEFEAQSDVARPNYRGSNNEKAALQEVFDASVKKTLAGLRAVPLSP
jgi:hypothetical protein